MEVHHHPQVEKKGFKEYLLEGLMIFLAVTMGFFAESIRENISENSKGKEYLKSFVEDLKTDSAQYTNQIAEFNAQDQALSGLDSCFDTISVQHGSTGCLVDIVYNASGFTDFIYTDRTIQQVKNSGGLHLIHDKAIADSIIAYDALVRADMIHQDAMERWQERMGVLHSEMLGVKSLADMRSHRSNGSKITAPKLLTNNERDINTYFNQMAIFRSSCHGQQQRLMQLQQKANRLIAFIKQRKN